MQCPFAKTKYDPVFEARKIAQSYLENLWIRDICRVGSAARRNVSRTRFFECAAPAWPHLSAEMCARQIVHDMHDTQTPQQNEIIRQPTLTEAYCSFLLFARAYAASHWRPDSRLLPTNIPGHALAKKIKRRLRLMASTTRRRLVTFPVQAALIYFWPVNVPGSAIIAAH